LDYRLNAANLLSGRYNGQRFKGTNLENSGTTSAAEHTGNSNVNTDTFALELNTTLTQKVINQLRGSYQRDNEPGLSNSQNAEAAVRNNGTTLLTVGRNNFSPRETTLHRQQYADAVTYVAGTHTLKFGVDWLRDQILNYFPGNFSGAYTFDSLENFGRSLSGQALNATATGSAALQLCRHMQVQERVDRRRIRQRPVSSVCSGRLAGNATVADNLWRALGPADLSSARCPEPAGICNWIQHIACSR